LKVRKGISGYSTRLPEGFRIITLSEVLDSGRFWRLRECERKLGAVTEADFLREFPRVTQTVLNDSIYMYGLYKKAFGE
ncbi:MAG: hypothetical protein RR063_11640, partial [Anaerovoracaceae bacterium]